MRGEAEILADLAQEKADRDRDRLLAEETARPMLAGVPMDGLPGGAYAPLAKLEEQT